MKALIPGILAVLAFAACSQGGTSPDDAGDKVDALTGGDDGGQVEDGDSGLADPGEDRDVIEPDGGDDTGTDAGNDAGGDGDSGPEMVSVCRWVCEHPRDCAAGVEGPYDEDNYACDDGYCLWLGCWSDEDCQAQLGMEDYVCREGVEGYVASSCFKSCLAALDCVMQLPAYDLDNYACSAGICEYLGCNNDEECRVTPDFAHYVCTGAFTLVPMCMPGCFTPADCDMGAPAYDTDNYDCTDGVCVYSGCNTDEECDLSDATHEAVCR